MIERKPGEVEKSRSVFGKKFESPEGTRVVLTSRAQSFQFQGQWFELDRTPAFDGRVWSTPSTPYRMEWDAQAIALTYINQQGKTSTARLVALDGVPFEGKAQGNVDGYSIKTRIDDLEIELRCRAFGVEIYKILHSDKAPKALTWEITGDVDAMNTRGWDNLNRQKRNEFVVRRRIELEHEQEEIAGGFRVTERFTGRTRFVDADTRARTWLDEAIYPVEIDVTVSESVVHTDDDGFSIASPYWYNAYMVVQSGKSSAIRFQTVDVPQGATVSSASLTINVTARGGTGSATFAGQATDDAAAWAYGSANSPLTMSATTANLSYSTPATTGLKVIDVTAIVQEIVNRGGWTNNNDMRFGWTNLGSIGASYFFIEDYQAAGTAEAELEIIYTAGAGKTTKNSRSFPLGIELGMERGMPL